VEAKIRQEKTRCIQEKRAKNMEKAKLIYLEVMELEKQGSRLELPGLKLIAAELRAQMNSSSSCLEVCGFVS
jgi:hypothetical protein